MVRVQASGDWYAQAMTSQGNTGGSSVGGLAGGRCYARRGNGQQQVALLPLTFSYDTAYSFRVKPWNTVASASFAASRGDCTSAGSDNFSAGC